MKKIKDYNVEGKTIKEINQGTHYCYIDFTDGTTFEIDVRGDAYIDYTFEEKKE